MKNGLTKAVNEMHETPVDDVFIFESWIVDDVKGVPEGFQDVPQGSWFGSMRIENAGRRYLTVIPRSTGIVVTTKTASARPVIVTSGALAPIK